MDPTAQAAFPCHVSPPIPGGPPNSGDPPADESGVYDPTVDELAYWRTPAWKRIVELLRRCECLPDDAVTAEAVRLSRFEPNPDPGDHRLLSELRRCATNVVLSLHKRKWSFGWLHSLCGKYLDNLDLLEEHIRRLPEAVPADSGVGLEWANDITAFWDIAPKVGGNRPPCPCPNDRTELKFREVKGEVRRLMD